MLTANAAIGSLMIYQVGSTCLMVPQIPVRSLTTYFAGGPFAICDLALQEGAAIEAEAHALLLQIRASDGAVLPKFDHTVAAESFAGLMRDLAATLGLSVAKLEKAMSAVFVTCKGDVCKIAPAVRGRGKFAFGTVQGHELKVDLAGSTRFSGALVHLLRSRSEVPRP